MDSKTVARIFLALALSSAGIFGQTITSNIQGTITDPADAVVPAASITLTETGTGTSRSFTTGSDGIFHFTSLQPGDYSINVAAKGFKGYTQTAISLVASETRDLGRVHLTIGATSDSVTVTAEVAQVQTATSEKSATIESNQVNEIALRGRDLFGFLSLIPGVTNSLGGGETTGTGLPGTINGGGQKNFTVDGITDMDTGSNGTVHFEPNLDSISEIRVLTSNFAAEYGRNADGQVAVVTKSGTQQFHGAVNNTWRNEELNAKDFFTNFNGTPKSVYRYDIYAYSVGGPIYIPKIFNKQKKKLFGFISQEWTKQKPSTTINYYNMPTLAERQGDFSHDVDQNGKLIQLLDPKTRLPIPNNIIAPGMLFDDPAAAATGQKMLNVFAPPNRCDLDNNAGGCYTETDPTQLNRRNYEEVLVSPHPRRDDVARIDWNITSKLNTYVRYGNDYDLQTLTSAGAPLLNAGGTYVPYTEDHPNPGHGWAVGITYTISSRMVNEFTYGKSYNTWDWYVHDPSQVQPSLFGNPPHWYDQNGAQFKADVNQPRPDDGTGSLNFAVYAPAVAFGGGATTGEVGFSTSRPYTNWNDIYSYADNLSYVRGKHSLKAGIYWERTGKVQQSGQGSYLGSYNFASSSSFPQDTGDGYANAYLGNFQSYSEGARVVGDFWFTEIEAFLQDSWKVSRRVTVELGVRFYHSPPYENLNRNSAVFDPATYSASQAMRQYYPFCSITTTGNCPAADEFAKDSGPGGTGFTTFPSLVGTLVPASVGGYSGTPNIAPGMQLINGNNPNLPGLGGFSAPSLKAAPRVGLAWDVFGNGKTAVRTGFGQFYNRWDGNQIFGLAGQPPVTVNKQIFYSQIDQIPSYQNSAAVTPIGPSGLFGFQQYQSIMNFSFGVQQNVGFGTVVDASYVGALTRHSNQSRQINPIPQYSEYDPAFNSPWTNALYANASGKELSDNYFRPLAGLGSVNQNNYAGSSNYHSLQISIKRNSFKGLSYGLAYTWDKILAGSPSVNFTDARNYGASFNGAPQVIGANYIYQIPGLGKKFHMKPLGVVTDNWLLSGVTSWQAHAMMSAPAISITGNTPIFTGTSTLNPAPNFTGSADGPRMNVVGNPTISSSQVSFNGGPTTAGNYTFNWQAFAPPQPCSPTNETVACYGNAGAGAIFSVPTWVNNWDVTMAKSFSLGEKRKLTIRGEAYNVFNHTQFSGINTNIQYDLTAFEQGRLVQTNNQLGRYTSAVAPRRGAITVRLEF